MYFAILVFSSQLSFAQTIQEPLISGLFPGISFEMFANRIEKEYPYQIFFVSEEVADIRVNISARDNTLGQILQSVLEDTNLKYFIDERNRVFISKENPLNISLAKDFFNYLKRNDSLETESARLSDIERAFRNKLLS